MITLTIAATLLVPIILLLIATREDAERLLWHGWERLESGDALSARHDFEAYLAARPDSSRGAYALACAEAALGAMENSLAWLERAADLCFGEPDRAAEQPELTGLREDERFNATLARMAQLA